MTLRVQLESYRDRMAAFNQWEAAQPLQDRSAAAILADLGFLLSFVSVEDRLSDPDPHKLGIQRMRELLARDREMTDLESALIEIAAYLDQERRPYMLIGGLANVG
jgi:hypothetical protein